MSHTATERDRDMSTEHLAAEQIRLILSALPASGTARDKRVRRAMSAAARALETGHDPHRAIGRVYRRRV